MHGCSQGEACIGYDEIRRYGQCAGGTHPTGMHSCFHGISFRVSLSVSVNVSLDMFASCTFPLDPLAHAHAHPTHSVHFCCMNVVKYYPLSCKTYLYYSIDRIQLLLEIQALFTPTDLNIHDAIESQITRFKSTSQWLVLVRT